MDGHVETQVPADVQETPLTLAAYNGQIEMAKLLIIRGEKIDETNGKQYTALMQAARKGHKEMVTLLVKHGAKVNAQTETRQTALTLACFGGFLEIVQFLINGQANIELGALTPLMIGAHKGHYKLVEYLLQSKANIHAQTESGCTALIYACEKQHISIADLLVKFGADVNYKSKETLNILKSAGYHRTVQYLATINTTNNDHIPLPLAYAGDHCTVVGAQSANPSHNLKDNYTMLIETAQGKQQQQQFVYHQQHLPYHQQTSTQLQHQQQQNLQFRHNIQNSITRHFRYEPYTRSHTSAEAQQPQTQSQRSNNTNIFMPRQITSHATPQQDQPVTQDIQQLWQLLESIINRSYRDGYAEGFRRGRNET